ncbi:MAG: cbb3-type cytochrome c oxidase subunit 3 [Alphaproteobacteria bacterium]|nr:cbb3-type cytochrome c oxidase subunit 3 [Alphaproteobacteria bacterium]
MSGLSYEAVARFAQQAGLIYFGVIFLIGVAYALRPSKKAEFQHAARMPLEDEELV